MTALLQVSSLRKEFGGLVAVNDVAFTIGEGEIVGLLGPNGSGKSTVINLISGALKPTAGAVTLRGTTTSGKPADAIARHGVARTFQLVRILPSLSLVENVTAAIAFGRNPRWGAEAETSALAQLERVGLAARAGEHASNLNYIDQKRLELARALAAEPELLLLDEWLAGLNPTELKTGIDLILSLRDSGATVLLVEHIMEAVHALCSRCVVMNTGQVIADGDTAAVMRDPEVIRAYLGEGHA